MTRVIAAALAAAVATGAAAAVPPRIAAECPQAYRIGGAEASNHETIDVLVLPDGFTADELPIFRCATAMLFDGLSRMKPYDRIASSVRVYRIDQAASAEGIEVAPTCPPGSSSGFQPFSRSPDAPGLLASCAGFAARHGLSAGTFGEPIFAEGAFCATCTSADLGFFHDPAISPDCRVLWTDGEGLRRVWRYTRCVPDVDVIVVVTNSVAHAGGGTADAHPPTSVITLSEIANPRTRTRLLGHEIGHALGLLDEYALGTGEVPEFQSGRNVVRRLPDGTIETPPWSDRCVNPDGTRAASCVVVQGTTCTQNPPPMQAMPHVGLFEGAFYQPCGYYRASDRCLLDQEGRYCVGCRVYLEKLFQDLEIPLAADTPDAPDVTSPPR